MGCDVLAMYWVYNLGLLPCKNKMSKGLVRYVYYCMTGQARTRQLVDAPLAALAFLDMLASFVQATSIVGEFSRDKSKGSFWYVCTRFLICLLIVAFRTLYRPGECCVEWYLLACIHLNQHWTLNYTPAYCMQEFYRACVHSQELWTVLEVGPHFFYTKGYRTSCAYTLCQGCLEDSYWLSSVAIG